MDNEGLTQYTRIAISLAERIGLGPAEGRRKALWPVQALTGVQCLPGDHPPDPAAAGGYEGSGGEGAERCLCPVRRQCPPLSPQLRGSDRHTGKTAAAQGTAGPSGTSEPSDGGPVPGYFGRDQPDARRPAQLLLPHSRRLAPQRHHRWGPAVLAGYRCHHRGHPPRPVLHRLTRSLCRAVRRRRGDLRGRRQGREAVSHFFANP